MIIGVSFSDNSSTNRACIHSLMFSPSRISSGTNGMFTSVTMYKSYVRVAATAVTDSGVFPR